MASDETSTPTPAEEPVVAVAGEQKSSSDDTTNAVATVEKDDTKKEEEDGSESKPEDSPSNATPKEEDSFTELKEFEKKALLKLRAMVEDAILGNKIFNNNKSKELEKSKSSSSTEQHHQEKGDPQEKAADDAPEAEKQEKQPNPEVKEGETDKETTKEEEEKVAEEVKESEEKEKSDAGVIEEEKVEVDRNISLWGVSLLPSKGDKATDVVLLKFLRAKEFRTSEAFEMLRTTLQWRKEMKIDSVLEEDFGPDLNSAAYISGVDREGHPVCYNVYGVFGNDEIYNKTLGTEEGREKFLRWRSQLMEKGIQMLDFQPGGVSSLVQISDLKNTPGPARKELRLATKQDVGILQDNYPELVARNIFINVPFWYYAFNALLPPLLTPKNKSKFVFARPAKVNETLLKYLTAAEIPVQYGGLKRENDNDFSVQDEVQEISLKGSSTEVIDIPAPEAGSTLVWEFTVLGWDIEYKEEFVPEDPKSYTIIVQKDRTVNWMDDSVRNSFTTRERGKVVLTIENGSFKKKRVLYRFKAKDSSASSSTD